MHRRTWFQEIAGHSDIDVTMTIHAHVSLDQEREALGKHGEALVSRGVSSLTV